MVSKKTMVPRIAFLILFAAALGAVSPGCGNKPVPATSLVRYQSVSVPLFHREDYEALLWSENLEIRSNATVKLIWDAREYAALLSGEDGRDPQGPSLKGDPVEAEKVLARICDGLRSDNEDVKVASLLFLQEFAPKYSGKKALIGLVTQVATDDDRTRYEILETVESLLEPETRIDLPWLGRFLESPSWRVRSKACSILSSIVCDELHPVLIRAYRAAVHDVDRLLILSAFERHYGGGVFEVVKEAVCDSRSSAVRMMGAMLLTGYEDSGAVARWLGQVYLSLDDDLVIVILGGYADRLSCSQGMRFFDTLLAEGPPGLVRFLGREQVLNALYDAMDKESGRSDFAALLERLRAEPEFRQGWDALAFDRAEKKAKNDAEEALLDRVMPEYLRRLDAFLADTRRFLADAGLEPDDVDDAMKDMKEWLQLLRNGSAPE
jgi:hypothetical protein